MMFTTLLLLALALPSGEDGAPPRVASPSLAQETPAESLLRQAQQLRYAQRWFEAAATYRQFLEQFPTSDKVAIARFYLAATLERDQRWDEGAAAYTDFLQKHADQHRLGIEAKLSRIACWGMRQGQHPEAMPGLLEALKDGETEVRVKAALELARSADRRALPALREGLVLPAYAERCTMALIAMHERPESPEPSKARFLVMRIKEQGAKPSVEIRLSLAMARAIANYLSDDQANQLRRKGIDIENLSSGIWNMPKGSLVFSVEDRKSSVTVTVE